MSVCRKYKSVDKLSNPTLCTLRTYYKIVFSPCKSMPSHVRFIKYSGSGIVGSLRTFFYAHGHTVLIPFLTYFWIVFSAYSVFSDYFFLQLCCFMCFRSHRPFLDNSTADYSKYHFKLLISLSVATSNFYLSRA